MVGEHQENNRQGEVVVMGGADFCNLAIFGIRHAPRLEVCDDDTLVWHDLKKHVRRHDGGRESAQVKQSSPTCENLIISPRHRDKDQKQKQHQCAWVFRQF